MGFFTGGYMPDVGSMTKKVTTAHISLSMIRALCCESPWGPFRSGDLVCSGPHQEPLTCNQPLPTEGSAPPNKWNHQFPAEEGGWLAAGTVLSTVDVNDM